ncbi:hypothetical protein R3W88_009004 [Solanum pinnatisectum]|uniref:Uncharacterized protein n=1 Tax=Solanum pinnatisectum TaxID=50273 RepID=A0AAV9MA73_9SOLN|nr:hypothetical protein R3W88_009004 [Solanum pinnatisectum]
MAENENDWDLWAIVRSCSKMSNSALVDHGVHEDGYSALVDHSVHEDGNSVNTSLFQEESSCVGDFRDAFAMENKRYFGLDEVVSLSKNLNTNSRIAPHNQENQTETIPNTPLEFGKAEQWRWIMNKTSTTGKNYYLCSEFKKKISNQGDRNHPPPNQHRSPNAAAPPEDPSTSSFVP